MSSPTTTYADDAFEDFEFAAIVAGFDTVEPDPRTAEESAARSFRPSRAAERREAREQIDRGLGYNRHRTSERES